MWSYSYYSEAMATYVFLWLAMSACLLETQAAPKNIHIHLYGISVNGGGFSGGIYTSITQSNLIPLWAPNRYIRKNLSII